MPIPELRSVTQIVNDDGLLVDVPHLEKIESRGRTSHVHWDGCEVQRQFYVNHYWAAPHVCAALLGFVLRETTPNGGQVYKRYLPAFDPIYNQILYCNEARWEHVDKQSISAAAPLGAISSGVPIGLAYKHFMDQVNAVGEDRLSVIQDGLITEGVPGGAFITASYRPMLSGYQPPRYNGVLTPASRDRQFDFMDPVITPANETVGWPDGMFVVNPGIKTTIPHLAIPTEVGSPITVPTMEFRVKRMFLGHVPYERFNAHLGKVNDRRWPVDDEASLYTFPQFPAECLKFESYDVTRHWSQLSNNNEWYEVEFTFLWRCLQDGGVYRDNGNLEGWSDVTWNHVLCRPSFVKVPSVLGWHYVHRADRQILAWDASHGPLYTLIPFNLLFESVTPGMQ